MVCALTVSARCLAAFSTASPTLLFRKTSGWSASQAFTAAGSAWLPAPILIIFGMVPKMAVLVASIPQFVLGGAGLVMFGMVLRAGVSILARINYSSNRYNLYIVAISLGVGLTPTLSHDFFSKFRQYCSRYCIAGSCWPRSAPSPSICSLTVTTNTRG